MIFNPFLAEAIERERMEEFRREAEKRRLLREAGVDTRLWLIRQICRLLNRLGYLLVVLGRRLERMATPPVAPTMKRRANGASH